MERWPWQMKDKQLQSQMQNCGMSIGSQLAQSHGSQLLCIHLLLYLIGFWERSFQVKFILSPNMSFFPTGAISQISYDADFNDYKLLLLTFSERPTHKNQIIELLRFYNGIVFPISHSCKRASGVESSNQHYERNSAGQESNRSRRRKWRTFQGWDTVTSCHYLLIPTCVPVTEQSEAPAVEDSEPLPPSPLSALTLLSEHAATVPVNIPLDKEGGAAGVPDLYEQVDDSKVGKAGKKSRGACQPSHRKKWTVVVTIDSTHTYAATLCHINLFRACNKCKWKLWALLLCRCSRNYYYYIKT